MVVIVLGQRTEMLRRREIYRIYKERHDRPQCRLVSPTPATKTTTTTTIVVLICKHRIIGDKNTEHRPANNKCHNYWLLIKALKKMMIYFIVRFAWRLISAVGGEFQSTCTLNCFALPAIGDV